MKSGPVAEETSIQEKLQEAVRRLPPDTVTMGQILDLLEREGLLLLCVFMTIPFLVPVSIPGVSTVFGAVILCISMTLIFGRMPRLPRRMTERAFSSPKLREAFAKGAVWLGRIGKLSRPHRLQRFVHGRGMEIVNGLMLAVGAVLLMAPFGLIPFSNTLPGVAILLIAVGILQCDGGCVLAGYLANAATILYFGILLTGGGLAIREGLHRLLSWLT